MEEAAHQSEGAQSGPDDRMVEMPRRKFQGGSNIFVFQIWIVPQDFRAVGAIGEHIKDVRDTDSLTANAGPAAKHLRIRCYAIDPIHIRNIPDSRSRCIARHHAFGGGGGAVK